MQKSSQEEEVALLEIANSIEVQILNANEYVFRQGDEGDKFYILITGTLIGLLEPPKNLTNNLKRLEQSREIFKLQPGSYFGELALKNHSSRSCSVKAIEMSACAVLRKQDFLKVVGEEASKKQFDEITDFLLQTQNFKSFPRHLVEQFSTKVNIVSKSSGDVLIKQGENCLQMFILKSGHASIKRRIDFSKIRFDRFSDTTLAKVQELPRDLHIEVATKTNPGALFCYHEILNQMESLYTVQVTIPSKIFSCSASDFFQVFRGKDMTALFSNDRFVPSSEHLLLYYIDRHLWTDYSHYLSTTVLKQREIDRCAVMDDFKKEFNETLGEKRDRVLVRAKAEELGWYFKDKFMKLEGQNSHLPRIRKVKSKMKLKRPARDPLNATLLRDEMNESKRLHRNPHKMVESRRFQADIEEGGESISSVQKNSVDLDKKKNPNLSETLMISRRLDTSILLKPVDMTDIEEKSKKSWDGPLIPKLQQKPRVEKRRSPNHEGEYQVLKKYGSLCRTNAKMFSIGEVEAQKDDFLNNLVNHHTYGIIQKSLLNSKQRKTEAAKTDLDEEEEHRHELATGIIKQEIEVREVLRKAAEKLNMRSVHSGRVGATPIRVRSRPQLTISSSPVNRTEQSHQSIHSTKNLKKSNDSIMLENGVLNSARAGVFKFTEAKDLQNFQVYVQQHKPSFARSYMKNEANYLRRPLEHPASTDKKQLDP